MCEVQTEYREQMPSPWEDPKYRQEQRQLSFEQRSIYLEGKLSALSAISLTLVRLVAPVFNKVSRKENPVDCVQLVLDTLPVEPPSPPTQDHLARQYADGWNDVRGMIDREVQN